MTTSFTDAFNVLPPDECEAYHRTVFMHMDTPHAAALRQEYYRGLLRRMGTNVRIGCGVTFLNPQFISLGDSVTIDDHCTLRAKGEPGITIDEGTRLQYGVYLDSETAIGYIHVGKRVYIGTGSSLFGHSGLEIGDDTLMAQNITITPYSHKFDDPAQLIKVQGGNTRKMTIGRDCYIGKAVSIVYTADIGEGSVVGSGSVVVRTVPPFSIAVGVPAKVIRKRGELKAPR